MLGREYESQSCSIASALEVIGERWSLLIVRDVFLGLRRFEQIQADLGIARNILQRRLCTLTEQGVLERRRYQDSPPRHEYRLTEKGIDLWPAIVALMQWGDRHAPLPAGPPVLIEHRGCGGAVDEHRICERCGARLSARDALALPGPGARPDHPLVRRGAPSSSRPTSAAPSRAMRERGTTRSKPARSARSRTSASTCE
ncbi:MAG TPA: helix-turn-helix domain-containing protein [Solirubrobacteraceae bacterium]|nr:helix-turn-helix domain-containing protein [Solirubrobacteraceae bacterium]